MIALSSQILSVMVVLMLAVVGALVLSLHFTLHRLKKSDQKLPSLTEMLSESLQKANRGVFELSRLIRENGPKLEKEVYHAQQTVQDLEFMTAKAEKLLKRMDEAFERAEKFSVAAESSVRSEEKKVLFGEKVRSAPAVVQASAVPVAPVQNVATPRAERAPVSENRLPKEDVSAALKNLQSKMEKDFFTNGNTASYSEEKPFAKPIEEAAPSAVPAKRMASPMAGAMAYGKQLSVPPSDAEKELRQALEGRLS